MDDVQNISKCYYNTQYSELSKVSTLADFQGSAMIHVDMDSLSEIVSA